MDQGSLLDMHSTSKGSQICAFNWLAKSLFLINYYKKWITLLKPPPNSPYKTNPMTN